MYIILLCKRIRASVALLVAEMRFQRRRWRGGGGGARRDERERGSRKGEAVGGREGEKLIGGGGIEEF